MQYRKHARTRYVTNLELILRVSGWVKRDWLPCWSTLLNKPDDNGDDDPDCNDVGPDIDEDKLIAQKTEFKREFILEFRNLFSESLSPN